MPFTAIWMDLEIILPSEVSPTEKDKYPMRSHKMWKLIEMRQLNSQTKILMLHLQNGNGKTDFKNKFMVTKEEMNGEEIN